MTSQSGSPVPPEVIEAFTSAALTAIQELIQPEAFGGETGRKTEDLSFAVPIVAASVRLMRREPGQMTLVLPVDSAALLAARYLPQATGLTEEIIDDVAGEFANVIAGQAKTMLKGTPFHFTMSPPSIFRAGSLAALPQETAMTRVVSLTADWGRLLVLLELSPCPGA